MTTLILTFRLHHNSSPSKKGRLEQVRSCSDEAYDKGRNRKNKYCVVDKIVPSVGAERVIIIQCDGTGTVIQTILPDNLSTYRRTLSTSAESDSIRREMYWESPKPRYTFTAFPHHTTRAQQHSRYEWIQFSCHMPPKRITVPNAKI